MSPFLVFILMFVALFGAAMIGVFSKLPEHHISTETKDTVKMGVGIVGTMAALLLSLMLSAARDSYNIKREEIAGMASRVIYLDRLLAEYGGETAEARKLTARMVQGIIDHVWIEDGKLSSQPSSFGAEDVFSAILRLAPANDAQRELKSEAVSLLGELRLMRWELFEQEISSVSAPLLVIMAVWLAMVFLSFGIFAPVNGTVITALLLSALSVSGAVFLILEMDRPFSGMLRLSSEPLRQTVSLSTH